MAKTDTNQASHNRLHDGYDRARDAAGEAARRASDGLESNPLGVVVGGLAIGALVGALLPRSERERAALAPVGRKLGESARAAVQAAREAGYAELDQRGLTRHAAEDQARGLLDGLGAALSSAGTAAAGAARAKGGEPQPAGQGDQPFGTV
jgi:hypothetical protein